MHWQAPQRADFPLLRIPLPLRARTHIPAGAAGALANGANAAGGAAVAPGKASATTGESAKLATAAPGSTTETAKTGTKTANRSANLPSALKTDSSRARNELVKNGDPVDSKVTKMLPSSEWRAHHLIPVKAVRDNQELFTKASEIPGGFKTDESTNLTALPNTPAAQTILQKNGIDRPVHDSGHTQTTRDVNARLDVVKRILRREGLKSDSPDYGQRANDLIRSVEQQMRQQLPNSQRLSDNANPASSQSSYLV